MAGSTLEGMEKLTARDESLLRFEDRWGQKHTGAKEEAIRGTFGMRTSRYYQRLNELTNSPAAVAAFPQLVTRLQRLRDERLERRRTQSFALFDA